MDMKDKVLVSAPSLYVAEHDGYNFFATNMPLLWDQWNANDRGAGKADGGGLEVTLRKNQVSQEPPA